MKVPIPSEASRFIVIEDQAILPIQRVDLARRSRRRTVGEQPLREQPALLRIESLEYLDRAVRRRGQRCRVRRASTWEPDSAQDELQRVNPLGQIPTLVAPRYIPGAPASTPSLMRRSSA